MDELTGGHADDRAAMLYRYAVHRGEVGPLEPVAAELGLSVPALFLAATRLVELQLLRTDAAAGDRLVPVEPEIAAARLVTPLERAMYQRREQADQLRDRISAIARPAAVTAGDGPVGAIDSLDGAVEIRGLFKLAAEVCRQELVVLQPSHDQEDLLDELLSPCYGVLDREVTVRVVCPHRSRTGFATRARAKRLIGDGAQIRTLSQVPQAAVVFDHALAVMITLPDAGREPTARRVRDVNVVRFLVDLFDQLWESATPFTAAEPGYADAADDLQQSLARLMAQGLTDEVVARRLGMSVRTCRRHIAGLLRDLDAVSRFQAGVQAAGRFTVDVAPSV
jgi:hypothetical protein